MFCLLCAPSPSVPGGDCEAEMDELTPGSDLMIFSSGGSFRCIFLRRELRDSNVHSEV